MTYVVTETCIKCKYTDCVDVCPVDCFREGPNFLVIDPGRVHRLHAVRRRVPGRGDLRRGRRAARPAGIHRAQRRAVEGVEAHHRAQARAAGCRRVEGREGQAQATSNADRRTRHASFDPARAAHPRIDCFCRRSNDSAMTPANDHCSSSRSPRWRCAAPAVRRRPRPPATPRRAARRPRCARAATASPAGAPPFPRSTRVPKLGGPAPGLHRRGAQGIPQRRAQPSVDARHRRAADRRGHREPRRVLTRRRRRRRPSTMTMRPPRFAFAIARSLACRRLRRDRRRPRRRQGEGARKSARRAMASTATARRARLPEARRAVSRLPRQGAARLPVGPRARTRSWRAWRRRSPPKDIENLAAYYAAQPSVLNVHREP